MRNAVRFTSVLGCTDALLRLVNESIRSRHRLFAVVIAVETACAICWGDLFQHEIKVSTPVGGCGVSKERKIVWVFES